MVDYTTIRIKKSSLDKIEKLKGDNLSAADVVEKLLNTVDGCTIDDIVEVKRDNVAILLEYTSFGDKKEFYVDREYGITFQDLKLSKVGDMFTANPDPADEYYMNETAEVLFVDDRSVLVRVTELVKSEEGQSSMVHIEHIDLF